MEIMDIVRKSNPKQFVELNAKLKLIELLEEKGKICMIFRNSSISQAQNHLYKTVYLIFHLVNSLGFLKIQYDHLTVLCDSGVLCLVLFLGICVSAKI